MPAPIHNDATKAAGPAGLDAGARPQLQSRRVSLKLGPFGLTYATDQVLWSAAASSAAAGAEALAPGAAAQQAEQARRSFSQELLEAGRRQARERAAAAGRYGPDGVLRSGEEEAAAEAAPDADGAETSEGADASRQGTAAAQASRPPASRMRRAIAAYLSCAGDFAAARPMLCSVA